jgi:DNA polymerase elongation subunit (family B)
MPRKKKTPAEIAVLDFETDPFRFGRTPLPFVCGVLWRGVYAEFWGADCADQAADYLASIDTPLMVYAHNGGRFDFFFLLKRLSNPIKLINARIVSAKLGRHELRDSWAIMPFSLATFQKTPIDYRKFEPEVRDQHREEICAYLHDDCRDLMTLCVAFVERFGFQLTIAGTAMKQLTKLHPQESCNEGHDERLRPYYFGGRVECFESGIQRGKFKVYDVNSMYPAVMSAFDHPLGAKYLEVASPTLDRNGWLRGYPSCLYFCEVEGTNLGALPVRLKEGLSFTQEEGIFQTTSHELRAAIELGKFHVKQIRKALIPHEVQSFGDFVDVFTAEKIKAKREKDRIGELFAKLILNSAYGKFGQDPRNFLDYYIQVRGVNGAPQCGLCGHCLSGQGMCTTWELQESADQWVIWGKPTPSLRFFDVGIAASVTSAARAVLMRGIAGAVRPMYCDTDSIICEELADVVIDDYALGAWKHEASGTRIALAGKKLYALFDGKEPVKWASKGTKLSPDDIAKVAKGGEVTWQSDAPNFSLTGAVKFVERTSKKTA